MTDWLLGLTLSGTIVFCLVAICEAIFARRVRAHGRRWWWLCVPLAFLFAIYVPILPPLSIPDEMAGDPRASPVLIGLGVASLEEPTFALLPILWIVGVLVSLLVVLVRTSRVSRFWTRQRLSTDSALLSLLEECKATAGVTAPIGIVCTNHISAPAILGWLRPRILLPSAVLALPQDRLTHILLHELAHFRSMDVPVGWAFTFVRCLHWFNPFAYLAEIGWSRFREEAADESVIGWSRSSSTYGDTLIAILRQAALPFGALGICESLPTLKHRLTMINHYQKRARHPFLTFAIFGLLVLLATFRPVHAQEADPKTAAVAAMQVWLLGVDEGRYAASWTASAPSFQKALTSGKWVAALDSVRKPLGNCVSRKLASALLQSAETDIVIAQFETSFSNMKYAIETVSFERDGDVWKAAGYYIKPAL